MDRTSTKTDSLPDWDLPDTGAQLGLFTATGSSVFDFPPLITEIDLRVEEDLLGMYYIG